MTEKKDQTKQSLDSIFQKIVPFLAQRYKAMVELVLKN